MTTKAITPDTPLAMLTVGQFLTLKELNEPPASKQEIGMSRKYVYGIQGLADIFGCSIPTAHRIKKSGKISGAITQIGRKIIVDSDLAMELAGRKSGGRG